MFKNRWANTYKLLFWPEYNESFADSSIISKHKLFNFDFQLPSLYWKSHYQWLLGFAQFCTDNFCTPIHFFFASKSKHLTIETIFSVFK